MLLGANEELSLTMQNETIEKVDKYKLVGVILDDKLNWKPHCDSVLRKLKMTYVMISKGRHTISQKNKLLLYNSLFRSYYTFGLEHYGSASLTTLKPLLTMQKKVLRAVFGKNGFFHIKPLMKQYKLLDILDETISLRIRYAKNILGKKCPQHLKKLLPSAIPLRQNTRSQTKHLLHTNMIRLELAKKSSVYQIPYLWNLLHETTQKLSKNQLKTWLRNQLITLYN